MKRKINGVEYEIEGLPEDASDAAVTEAVSGYISRGRGEVPSAPGTPSVQEYRPLPQSFNPAEGGNANFVTNNLAAAVGGIKEKALGAQMFQADVAGNKEKLAQLEKEYADLRKLNEPLTSEWGKGRVGNIVGNIIPDVMAQFAGGSLVRGGAKMLPGISGIAEKSPQLVKDIVGMVRNALGGAESGVTTPSENYDAKKQAVVGAASSVPAGITSAATIKVQNPSGRADVPNPRPLFSFTNPRKQLEPMLQQNLNELEGPLGPTPLLGANRVSPASGSSIPELTNALSQIPFFSDWIKKLRWGQKEKITENWTDAVNGKTTTLTPEHARAINALYDKEWKSLSNWPDVPLTDLPAELAPTLAKLRAIPEVESVAKGTAPLQRASKAATPQPPPAPPAQPGGAGFLQTPGAPPVPPAAPTGPVMMAVEDLVKARRRASQIAYESKDPYEKLSNEALRDALTNILLKNAPSTEAGAFFLDLLKRSSLKKDIWRSLPEGGQVSADDMLRILNQNKTGTSVAPGSPLERYTTAFRDQIPEPPLSQNRALSTSLLLGNMSGLTGGGAGWAAHSLADLGPTGTGIAALTGAATPAAALFLSKLLLGTEAGGRYITGQSKSFPARRLAADDISTLIKRSNLSMGNQLAQHFYEDHKRELAAQLRAQRENQ